MEPSHLWGFHTSELAPSMPSNRPRHSVQHHRRAGHCRVDVDKSPELVCDLANIRREGRTPSLPWCLPLLRPL